MSTPISNRGGSMSGWGKSPERPSMSSKETKESLGKNQASAFGSKGSMKRSEFRSWLRKQPEFRKEAWKHYPNLSQEQRIKKIESNIWGSSQGKWGSRIERNKKEVELRREEYRKELQTHKVRENIKEKRVKTFEAGLLDKFMGKNG